MTETEYRELRRVASHFSRKYGLDWSELVSETWVRMATQNYTSVVRACHHAAVRMIERNVRQRADVSLDDEGDWSSGLAVLDVYDIEWLELLSHLTEPQRQAMLLWAEGYSHREISEHMGISLDASKALVKRAKARLKTSMLSRC